MSAAWTTPRSAPVLGRSKVEREERLAYSLVSDLRTLLRPGTAALRLCRLSRRPLSPRDERGHCLPSDKQDNAQL